MYVFRLNLFSPKVEAFFLTVAAFSVDSGWLKLPLLIVEAFPYMLEAFLSMVVTLYRWFVAFLSLVPAFYSFGCSFHQNWL
mgnify:CR=1 FL=1